MTEAELKHKVRTKSIERVVGDRDHEGKSIDIPCYTFQNMNAGWWTHYMRTRPENTPLRVIALELEAMDAELRQEYVKGLPGDAVKRARGVDHGLGKAKAKYLPAGKDPREA